MLKNVFTVVLIGCFLLNTVSLNVLASNYQPNTISGREILDFKNEKNDFGFSTPSNCRQKEELINSINAFLEKLKDLEISEDHITELIENLFGNSSDNLDGKEFKNIINQYLQEFTFSEAYVPDDVAPGCLLPYVLSSSYTWVAAPVFMFFFTEAAFRASENCALMYGFWGLTSLSLGISSWTEYRICEIENSDNPDQDTIDKLRGDQVFMSLAAFICFDIGLLFALACPEPFFLIF